MNQPHTKTRFRDHVPYRRLISGMTVWMLLVLVLMTTSAAVAEIPRYSTDPHDFVSARMQHFWVDGKPFRFTGYNLRGMVHYGGNDILPWSIAEDRITNLNYMKSVGARVARVFVSCKFANRYVTGDRLEATLAAAAARDIYLIVAFTDEYNTGFCPAGDAGYYNYSSWNLLNSDWFNGGYNVNYLPQVLYLVNRFKNDPTIFAWQLGNELKCGWQWTDILAFSNGVATRIREIDQNHMVSHGTAGRNYMGLTTAQAIQLYEDFDFITIHPYNGDESLNDSSLAITLGKPLLVSEAGFSSDLYSYTERPNKTDADIAKWVSRGARGYMNWGLMATNIDMGDGDFLYGIDRVLTWKNHHLDFDAYTQVFTKWSQILSTTIPPAPERPINVQASDGDWPGQVVITWDKTFPADEYAVYRSDTQSSANAPSSQINLLPQSLSYTECGSYDQNNRGCFIYDGSLSTKWCCAHHGMYSPGDHWLIFDLGSVCTINRFVVKHASMGGEPTYLNTKAFYIESAPSMSGPWSTEFYVNNSTTVSSNTLDCPAPRQMRYVRLRVTRPNPSADWAVRIPEFEIWGVPGAAAVRISDWQSETSFVDTTVLPGSVYSYSVQARNNGGESPMSDLDDGYASSLPEVSIPAAKFITDGTGVFVSGGVVSAVFGDRFYIQTNDRSSGIQCRGSVEASAGLTALFRGTMTTIDGERVLTDAVPVEGSASSGDVPRPLGMTNRAIGGGAYGLQAGVTGGAGMGNIGLLVKTTGRVIRAGEDYVYIDDGSAMRDGTQTGQGENIGIRVICNPTGWHPGDTKVITGISSCFEVLEGLAPCILVVESNRVENTGK